MSTEDGDFLEQLRATFKVEAAEHVQAMAKGLLELEKTPTAEAQRALVETVFRAAHSLKGAARAVDYSEIESLCRSLEDVFDAWKRQESAPSPGEFDTLHDTLDAIAAAMSTPETPHDTGASSARPPFEEPVRLAEFPARVSGELAAPASAAGQATASSDETVRISVARLEARLLESEELLTAKIAAGRRAADLRELAGRFEAWKREWAAVEHDARTLRLSEAVPPRGDRSASAGLTRVLDFFDWSLEMVKSIEHQAAALGQTAEQDRYAIGKLVDDLLEDSKKFLLLPFATLVASFPKLVRDLCRDQGKEADLTIHGEDIEIDKRILEEMKDPLVHLLRNSVDHGIEPPGERARLGKPPRARITLTASHFDSKVQLLLSDDGAGIDTGRLREWAVRHQQISADEAGRLGEAEAQALIFQSGVSTSPMITQVSGRGLGLAIVREKAEKLGGTVSVESRPGLGTTFRIIVPATRATFRGILVEAAGRQLVVPTTQVERVASVTAENVKTVEGRATLSLGGRVLALVQLADALELPQLERRDASASDTMVLILGSGEQRVAFAVDAVLEEQEVLVKPLRKPLSRVRNVAAATVLASGRVAPILNVADLLKSASKVGTAAVRVPAGTGSMQASTVLVAEDSITSRMMIKNILESAGYRVRTAVDGMEAFNTLRTEKFDLVVSDVEMPRLSGFDLTARIRADPKLAELPVILVTALQTREDRERGIDAGANAYLVKSGFDQSILVETVRRLI